MKNLLVFACLLIGLQYPQTAAAQATPTISPNPVGVIGVPVPPAAVNTAASDSLRKRPFRYGVSPEWDNNHKKPLIVINGEIDDRQSLTIVNPQDIEKIEILKGVQAATVYGQRGVDGVIVIMTKKQENNRPREKGRLN